MRKGPTVPGIAGRWWPEKMFMNKALTTIVIFLFLFQRKSQISSFVWRINVWGTSHSKVIVKHIVLPDKVIHSCDRSSELHWNYVTISSVDWCRFLCRNFLSFSFFLPQSSKHFLWKPKGALLRRLQMRQNIECSFNCTPGFDSLLPAKQQT